ncbi:hypothetical protein M0534_08960 [Methylonatrum kenyense]|uniref:hypothetical protein n=1 Tax=Methylonatrum kenyense TaxID=455253 RepID=UPI0020C18A48|nr:hypothetical protein [Methylonatrum kenyense]MCK8516453.1 hypothetical protein [Methylonatrum kenyense]
MRRFHLALAVTDVAATIPDYSRRLGAAPTVVVPGRYALWRTATLNLSIRQIHGEGGVVRHLGWEDPQATTLSVEHDINGLIWEQFSAEDQAREIRANWPETDYDPET